MKIGTMNFKNSKYPNFSNFFFFFVPKTLNPIKSLKTTKYYKL